MRLPLLSLCASSGRNSHLAQQRSHRRYAFEELEGRLLLYAPTGYEWGDPNVSFSFVPDGTDVEGYFSSLFAELDAVAPTEVWQREFSRALQTWSNVSTLNFHEVLDDGSPSGTSGPVQGNSHFGDIRLGAKPLGSYVAYAYYPNSYFTVGGDIFLDPDNTFRIGATYDLYSVSLHEVGHALGLDHTSGTVMNSRYSGVLTGLTQDDINGIQALYGARQDDAYDAAGRNDDSASATSLTVDASGTLTFNADLTSTGDLDYYQVTVPVGSDGTLDVSVNADGLSLLAPKVSVYDTSGNLVAMADVGAAYGTVATVSLSGLAENGTYFIVADGATADAFGMGAYRLDVRFGGNIEGPTDPPPTDPPSTDPPPITADRFEVNDSFAAATDLGRFNSRTETGLTLHDSTDTDYYRFSARKSGSFRISTQFAQTDGHYELTVYDSQQNVLASTTSQSVDLSLASGDQMYVEVVSTSGDLDVYDLIFEKTGGGGNSEKSPSRGGGKGRSGKGLLPDEGFAWASGFTQQALQLTSQLPQLTADHDVRFDDSGLSTAEDWRDLPSQWLRATDQFFVSRGERIVASRFGSPETPEDLAEGLVQSETNVTDRLPAVRQWWGEFEKSLT